MRDTTSESVINKLKHHFARHGVPETVVSDGGTQYTSAEFENFSKAWGFTHVLSTPGNAQANGCAEAHVKIIKRMMRKCAINKEDPYLALLNLRNIPLESTGVSPAQQMFGRMTRSLLPTAQHHLQHKENIKNHKAKEIAKTLTAERFMYRRSLQPLNIGDKVRVQPIQQSKKTWEEAIISNRMSNRRYEIKTKNGKMIRNRRLLRKTQSSPVPYERQKQIHEETNTQGSTSLVHAPNNETTEIAETNNTHGINGEENSVKQEVPVTTENSCVEKSQSKATANTQTPIPEDSAMTPTQAAIGDSNRYTRTSGRLIKPVQKLNL